MAMETSLGHLKNHVSYPADKAGLVAACNNMADLPAEDREWFANKLPEGNYENPEDVVAALLAKL